jgi:AraC family transcriptional regulator, transcriptional activator of pobA
MRGDNANVQVRYGDRILGTYTSCSSPRQAGASSRRPVAVLWLVRTSRPGRRLAYRPQAPSLVRTEVQRLDRDHVVVGYGQHSHEFFEIVVFDSGGGYHRVSGVAEEIRAGQVWMLPPGTPHDLGDLGDATGWVVVLGAEQLGLAAAADVAQPWLAHPLVVPFQQADDTGRPVPFRLTAAALRRWRGWLRTIEAELCGRRFGYPQAVAAMVHLLLVDAARNCGPEVPGRPDPLVTRALELVDERFRGPLTLADVAGALHVTPGHLTETVRRRTGRPLGEWILQRRMTEARLLLGETETAIGVVAAHCGFRTVGHFGRQFRRLHGMSPSSWRASVTTGA